MPATAPALPTVARAVRVESLEARALLALTIQLDYSLDTTGFFAAQSRRDVMQLAADALDTRLADTLSAITPGSGNTWQVNFNHPATGGSHTIQNPSIPSNAIRVYVGARSLGGPLGIGGPAGWGASGTQSWLDTIRGRGESGALQPNGQETDVAPAVGAITFDSTKTWHFDATTIGLGSGEFDFLSVAVHELGHVLGIGSAASWDNRISSGRFTGPASVAANGGTSVLLHGDLSHWAEGTTDGGKEAAMDPTIPVGTRKNFTPLDFAGLDDIGWELTAPPATTGSIAGTIFNDLDADGVRDTGEAGLANVRAFVDADKDGVYDTGERSALTSSTGAYTITGLAAGSHRVRHVRPTGYRTVSPSAGYHTVSLTSGQNSTGKNFADTQKVLISGTAFNDLDGDGVKDSGEAGIASRRIYLDADLDGVFDATETSTLTSSTGAYTFKTLAAGSYRVREVLPSGWRRTAPSAGYFSLTLASGASSTGRNFGSTQRVLISGTVFNDLDGDRVRDGGEAGLSGWRVFIDADLDGVFDSTEKSVLTSSSGAWSFKDLVAGTHRVRVVQQTGWTRTTPTSGYHGVTLTSGQTSTGKLFGERRIA
jgi:hypothetical protein